MYFVDYTGRRFGKLVVLERGVRNSKRGLYEWICKCDCGNIKSIIGADLRNKNTTSCGCMSSRKTAGNRTRTHGMSNTPLYAVWRAMKERCSCPSSKSYKDYGARGITICDEWLSFEKFYEDMGDSYKRGLTIERKNIDEGYNKNNCIWITKAEQSLNKRNTRYITYKGETLPFTIMCRKYNVSHGMVEKRLKLGWDVNRAFEQPSRKTK
jgi:hypothetical protein